MLASHALVLMGVPVRRVVRRVQQARDARYSMLRGYFHGQDDEDGMLEHEQMRLHSIALPHHAATLGKKLGELGLEQMGIEVATIRRRDGHEQFHKLAPDADAVLQAEDVLVLRGRAEALALAEARLLQH